ncbi:MAG TPA: L-histidine N(alpha)-methyltransferase, partial [Gemmatimonadales bacterium]|nr:L-histidine N(alpha)-methyltransferase [Gemmatimonadales bacterium]
MLAEVAAGLAAPQKELPPKYFYDHRGSELFEEITRLPEYYPTRTERALLQEWMPRLIAELGTRSLIELGAGSAEKSRIILSAMRSAGTANLYVPIDVSASFLTETASRLRREYSGLTVEPVVADIA